MHYVKKSQILPCSCYPSQGVMSKPQNPTELENFLRSVNTLRFFGTKFRCSINPATSNDKARNAHQNP